VRLCAEGLKVASIEQDIQQLNQNVASISATRTHYLTSVDGTDTEDNDKLENLTVETRQLTQRIKSRIQGLEGQPQSDTQIRKNQVRCLSLNTRRRSPSHPRKIALLRKRFLEAIQAYQREEHEGDQRARQQIAKQLHIGLSMSVTSIPFWLTNMFKSSQTRRHIGGCEGVHRQRAAASIRGRGESLLVLKVRLVKKLTFVKLTTSTRYGESRTAYKEVQERQQDLQRMEKTLAELAQLFNDVRRRRPVCLASN
jgi:syntaxin 1B/2/3